MAQESAPSDRIQYDRKWLLSNAPTLLEEGEKYLARSQQQRESLVSSPYLFALTCTLACLTGGAGGVAALPTAIAWGRTFRDEQEDKAYRYNLWNQAKFLLETLPKYWHEKIEKGEKTKIEFNKSVVSALNTFEERNKPYEKRRLEQPPPPSSPERLADLPWYAVVRGAWEFKRYLPALMVAVSTLSIIQVPRIRDNALPPVPQVADFVENYLRYRPVALPWTTGSGSGSSLLRDFPLTGDPNESSNAVVEIIEGIPKGQHRFYGTDEGYSILWPSNSQETRDFHNNVPPPEVTRTQASHQASQETSSKANLGTFGQELHIKPFRGRGGIQVPYDDSSPMTIGVTGSQNDHVLIEPQDPYFGNRTEQPVTVSWSLPVSALNTYGTWSTRYTDRPSALEWSIIYFHELPKALQPQLEDWRERLRKAETSQAFQSIVTEMSDFIKGRNDYGKSNPLNQQMQAMSDSDGVPDYRAIGHLLLNNTLLDKTDPKKETISCETAAFQLHLLLESVGVRSVVRLGYWSPDGVLNQNEGHAIVQFSFIDPQTKKTVVVNIDPTPSRNPVRDQQKRDKSNEDTLRLVMALIGMALVGGAIKNMVDDNAPPTELQTKQTLKQCLNRLGDEELQALKTAVMNPLYAEKPLTREEVLSIPSRPIERNSVIETIIHYVCSENIPATERAFQKESLETLQHHWKAEGAEGWGKHKKSDELIALSKIMTQCER